MIIYRYRCTVTEPLILVKKEKTEQTTETLDYIPGNTFRGIVAASLFGATKQDDQKIDDIIFNGKVQFGDAHLIINDERSYQIPLTFYKARNLEKDTLLNFNKLKVDDFKNYKKLKQYRHGNFISTNKAKDVVINKIEVGDRMKSSRNNKTRSSEKGGLFMYRYIKKGQVFEFEIRSGSEKYLNTIKGLLNGKTKFFGKSKTAEFGGAIEIKFLQKVPDQVEISLKDNILYAESNLCFLNEYGEFTATPDVEQLIGSKNKDVKIDWEKSQLRFRTFMPYNQHRQNWDAERLIIEKGSVFVFKKIDETDSPEIKFDKEFLAKGIGCFLTEGYGRVLVNPEFLENEIVSIIQDTNTINNNNTTPNKEEAFDDDIFNFLKNKYKETLLNIEIQKDVDAYIEKKSFPEKITPTQWSNVFTAATQATSQAKNEIKDFELLTKLLFTNDNAICTSGLNNPWKDKGEKLLKDFLEKNKANKVKSVRILSKKMRLKTIAGKKNPLTVDL